jgi:hypothetical protein
MDDSIVIVLYKIKSSEPGGQFFHDRNDLEAGFSALAGSSVYYMLAFAPSEMKLNGKFHALKVSGFPSRI